MAEVTDQELIDFTEFVATKFASNREGWKYSRDLGGLKYVRYESDYTGRNHWTRRVRRAFNVRRLLGIDRISRSFRPKRWDLKSRLMWAWVHIVISLQKDRNLPDGQVNGNLTFWEEDGEYIAMMGPTVGVKVVEFLKADPENEHAKGILAAMRKAHDASWGEDGNA